MDDWDEEEWELYALLSMLAYRNTARRLAQMRKTQ